MSKSKIAIIIGKEYSTRVKKRSFILVTLLTPLLLAALMVVPSLIMLYSGSESTRIRVSDNSGIVMPYFEDTKEVTYEGMGNADIDTIKDNFDSYNCDVVLYISPLDTLKNATVVAFSNKQVNLDLRTSIKETIDKALENNKLAAYNIPDIDKIMDEVKTDVSVKTYEITDKGETKESKVEIYMAIGYLASFLIYMFVFMFGSMVMRSVIEEKSNRIVEVIVSSVRPMQLMMGKIIGVALVALTQFVIWIALTVAIVIGFGAATGITGGDGAQSQQVQLAMSNPVAGDQIQAITDSIPADEDGIQSYINAISQVNFVQIILVFVIYFVLGYLLYASMFAAVGAACDNEADTQQLVLPVTLPLIVGLFIMLHTFQHPDSVLSFWGSMIPFTSPMVMMARISYGVPFWELAVSVCVLIATFVFIAYLSSKIYRTGILMYGKKNGWKELFKWMRNR